MKIDIGEVLRRALQIIWKHKVLWIFGILAGCSQGATYFNSNLEGIWVRGIRSVPPNLRTQISDWSNVIADNIVGFVVIFGAISLLVWLVMTFIGTFGKIGLISGTFQADGISEKVTFSQLFHESKPYFRRAFGLAVLIGLPKLIISVILIAGFYLSFAAWIFNDGIHSSYSNQRDLTILGCFCLFIPVKLVVDLIVRQAHNAIVLENIHVVPAIRRGWGIFQKNLGILILMVVLLGVIRSGVGLIITLTLAMTTIPFTMVLRVLNGQSGTSLIFFGMYVIVFVPVVFVLNGILKSFQDAVWTLTYLRLTRPTEFQPVLQEATV